MRFFFFLDGSLEFKSLTANERSPGSVEFNPGTGGIDGIVEFKLGNVGVGIPGICGVGVPGVGIVGVDVFVGVDGFGAPGIVGPGIV